MTARDTAMRVFGYLAPGFDLTEETALRDLGLDGVGIVELEWRLEDALGRDWLLPSEPLFRTVGDVLRWAEAGA